ncbi:MAG TPA: ABC transporter ATP-binding protein [Acidimicrobiales bacterium]|nr:ABC transporter ATP-binding protein [Acidimicrobiales bacterium]
MPAELPADPRPPASPLVRLWRYAGGHRRTVVSAITFSVLNKLADVMPELLIGAAVDVVVRGGDSLVGSVLGIEDRFDQLIALAILNVVVWVFESITDYAAAILWRNLAQTIEHEARMDAYRHVQRLELAWFEDQSTGGLLSILNDDVNQLERFLDIGANEIVRTAMNIVFVGLVFFVAEPILGVVAFAPIPLIVWASVRYQRRLEPRYTDVRAAAGDLAALLANNVSGIATIRSFTAEAREADRVEVASEVYRRANGRAIKLSSAFIPLIRMAILAAFTVTLIVGGRLALDGSMEVGVFSVLVYMTQRLLWPLTRLGETFDLYQRAMASTRRILDLLAVDPTIVDGHHALPQPLAGEVSFEGVQFGYGTVDHGVDDHGVDDGAAAAVPVLRSFDLHVPAGQTHAIVGSTGAGKSTVVKLLLRLYDSTGGRIAIDGVPVEEVPLVELRRAIGYVGQDVFLFQGTVRENLAYGRPDATDDELERAARLAEAHDFITQLPQGYDTIVGERGQKLSGGQRQRLSIARAILKDPAVLVLDEATSAVDNETEAAIQRSLELVGRDRTVIVIAHRLSTVRHADRIHVLEAGRVVEAGSHEDLVAEQGLYAALWRIQTGEVHALPSS